MMRTAQDTEPAVIIVLGATGDLTRRNLLPALYDLRRHGRLHPKTQILGVARSAESDDRRFRTMARQTLWAVDRETDEQIGRWCDACLHYQPLGAGQAEDYSALARRSETLERDHRLPGNRVFYLALLPGAFPDAIKGLGEAGLNRSAGSTRLVVEKPFGRDLVSARREAQGAPVDCSAPARRRDPRPI